MYVCLSVGVRKRQVAYSCSIVSVDVSNCSYRLTVHRVTSSRLFFYTPKTPKTSGKPGRQRQCLFQWPATGSFASGAGRHGWAPTNSDNLYGGDGGVRVCVWCPASLHKT